LSKYSSTAFLFEIDKADSGALTSGLTAYITKFGDVNVNKGAIESTPFGVSAAAYLGGVIKKYEPITIEGFFDDAAEPAPNAVLNIGLVTHAVTRSFSITVGTGETITGECWITDYKRGFTVGDYTTYSATIQPTGTITEATA